MNTAPDPAPPPAGEITPGQVLGRYELLLPIASGGMAMVWAARLKGTRGFQKIVAVKTMLPKLSEDEQFEKMFLDEASLASQIRHPHVVEILDLGEQDGVLFLVMEWIEGVPLNQLMKAARKHEGLPIAIAVRIVMQACAGLHAAHELVDDKGVLVGLVHRDVSPQNVLVTYDGVTKVVDFGVAKATATGDGATVAGQIKGKVAYMAPEQVKGAEIDRRVDVFALGIVLYALTTGKHPFRRESEAATMYNICAPQPVLPPRKVADRYPPQLEAVVLKALAKDPAKRFQTANEMLRALDQLPSRHRASTDEEVALFLREILGDRRKARAEALADAIERANQNPNARTDWSMVERSMPSGISIVSRPSGSVVGTAPTIAGQPTSQSIQSQSWFGNKVVLALGGAAILLSIAVVAAAFIARGGDRSVSPAASAVLPQPTVSASQQRAASDPKRDESVGRDEGESASSASGKPSTSTEASRTVPASRAVATPPVVTARAQPLGTRPPKDGSSSPTSTTAAKNWKHDPGF